MDADKRDRIDEMLQCRAGETALLVIDMQRGFLDKGAALEVPPGRVIIPNIQQLIAACRMQQTPIIFTRFIYDPEQPTLRGDPFGPEHLPCPPGGATGFGRPSSNCIPGEEGVNSPVIISELMPHPTDTIIDAPQYDKFIDTELQQVLQGMDIQYLIITGILTDICVHTTLCAASMRNYRVTAVTDAVATLWPNIQDACLDIWQRKFARLKTTEQMLTEINSFQ
jgi:nicotinamidase-related amidase